VLLWSLGLDPTRITEPRAAVLFGKARWIGPLMKGAEISEPNLTGIFSLVGADCECDLDPTWIQGTRLPVRWEPKLHALVTKSLGFDPENPLIKIEVSRILGRRGSGKGLAQAGPAAAEAPRTLDRPQKTVLWRRLAITMICLTILTLTGGIVVVLVAARRR